MKRINLKYTDQLNKIFERPLICTGPLMLQTKNWTKFGLKDVLI